MKKLGLRKIKYLSLDLSLSYVVELGFKPDLSHSKPLHSGPHCDIPEWNALCLCGPLPPLKKILKIIYLQPH